MGEIAEEELLKRNVYVAPSERRIVVGGITEKWGTPYVQENTRLESTSIQSCTWGM